MSITFSDHGPRTAVGWRQRFASAETECRRHAPAVAVPANEQNLDRLAALLRDSVIGKLVRPAPSASR